MTLAHKRFRRLALFGATIIALWFLSSWFVARKYVARAQPIQNEPTPSIGWGNIQPLRFETDDSEQIGAWFIEGRPNRPIVLFLHGNGSCRSGCLGPAEMLFSQGYGVLLISLRAHGDSTGQLNDFGYGARSDVIAAVKWLEQNHPGRPIAIWGQSLGSAAAAFAAGDLGERVSGYILDSPYRDLRSAVWNRLHMRLPPLLDVAAYAGLLTISPLVLSDIDQIAPINAISKIPTSVPVLILAGSRDQRAPPEDARAIHERIANHAKLIVIKSADHLQLQATNPTVYNAAISDFLSDCCKRTQ